MKKIIVGFLALALLFVGNSAIASGWNTFPGDCPLPLTIGNYTTGVGIQDGSNGCWTRTSVSANQGETINVAVYYDNTNNTNANNSVIHLTQSPAGSISNPSTTFSFSGSLTSSAGTLNLSQVTANLTSSQTLTFGQAKWFKMGSNTGISLPNGQTGYEAFGSGVSLGTIGDGDWGTVIFSFAVGTNGGGGGGGSSCTISNFTANGSSSTTIQSGNSVNLSWNTNDCTSVNVSGPNGFSNTSLSNSVNTYPTYSGTYTLSATGNTGTQTRTVYVNVNDIQSNCTISNFTANGSTTAYITSGNSVNLVWNTYGCTSVNVSGPNGYYSSSLSNSVTTYPSNSGTYTLSAYGNTGGTQTRTVYVNVDNNNQSYCTISNFTANGSTSTTIQQGGALNLSWSTYGCTSVSVYGPGISSNVYSSSQIIYPSNNAQYTLTAYGSSGGTQTRTVYVVVNPTIITPPVYNACAVTTVATNVTQNSATLNGLLTGSTGASYFEYGTTVNLGSRTVARTASGTFSDIVTGLSPNTSYFYRFVSQCSGGLSYGKLEVFQTQGTVVNTVRQVIVQGTTVVGTESPIMLKIEDRYQYIGLGDIVDYTVTYKNIGKKTLTKPVLQVIVPKGITLINSSRGTYSTDTNTLTVPLEDLLPNAEGVVYLQGRVDAITSGVAQIVTTAVLVYTSPSGAQENAIAYVLNNPRDLGNVLGASAFWSGLASIGLIGWLLILILILLIILLTRRYYGSKVVHTTVPGGSSTTTTHY